MAFLLFCSCCWPKKSLHWTPGEECQTSVNDSGENSFHPWATIPRRVYSNPSTHAYEEHVTRSKILYQHTSFLRSIRTYVLLIIRHHSSVGLLGLTDLGVLGASRHVDCYFYRSCRKLRNSLGNQIDSQSFSMNCSSAMNLVDCTMYEPYGICAERMMMNELEI